MTDEMLVEAIAPCPFCGGEANVINHRWSGNNEIKAYYVHCIKCNANGHGRNTKEKALAAWNRRALPPEMRAAGKMKRALARYMNAVSDLHGHFDWESGYGRTRGPVDEEFDAATEEARAALARAEALAKSEAGPVGAACGIKE